MSLRPIEADPDLSRLRDEGFDISIEEGYLVVRGVPFLDEDRAIRTGTLVMPISLAGDRTVKPSTHVAYFSGGTPFDTDGRRLPMVHTYLERSLGGGIVIDHLLSSRPSEGSYSDFHAKVTTYVAQIESPAQAFDGSIGARRAGVGGHRSATVVSPFRYVDTASSRAGIGGLSDRLRRHSIGIVGLGGTGSYILDLVAKTPVGRIHLWDEDVFEQHSAFRSPGAAAVEEIAAGTAKVDHFSTIYSRMHRGIVPHKMRISAGNVRALGTLDFAFVAVDSAKSRGPIVAFLERAGKPFIDVGMGLHATDAGIVGTLRVTTSTDAMREHASIRGRIPMGGGGGDDPYATNIQVADLNCLNAALAVVRWKRHLGFYADFEREHWSAYSIDGNALFNDERPEVDS